MLKPMRRCRTCRTFWHTDPPTPPRPSMQKTSFPKQDIRVLLLEGISPSAVEVFRAAGYSRIETHAKSLAGDDLKAAVGDAHIVGIRSRTQLTAEVLAEAKRL